MLRIWHKSITNTAPHLFIYIRAREFEHLFIIACRLRGDIYYLDGKRVATALFAQRNQHDIPSHQGEGQRWGGSVLWWLRFGHSTTKAWSCDDRYLVIRWPILCHAVTNTWSREPVKPEMLRHLTLTLIVGLGWDLPAGGPSTNL